MALKEILEKLKNNLKEMFKTNTKGLLTSDTLADNRQVLIPTYIKDLNINTNLSSEEIKKYEQYKKEINLSNYDSILKYAEESFKRMNELRDSILEHIEESAKVKREISKDKNFKKIITEEFESVFREYEAYDLFDDLNKIKRDTELRILAIQEKINEIEKSSRFKFWGARDRNQVLKSLSYVGDRLKINIASGTLLEDALNNELENNGFLRNSIENFIKKNSNNDEVKEVIEELLNNYYNENVRQYNAVSLLSNDAISKITPKYNLDEFKKLELNEQLKVIVQDRKKLRQYILDHKEELLPKLKEIKEDVDKKNYEIYDDYRNYPLWAKGSMEKQIKLEEMIFNLLNYEAIYNLFQKDISEEDKEKLYKALFLTLYNIDDGTKHNPDKNNIFLHKISYLDKKSYKICKKYFCKFIDEMMERLVKTSDENVLKYINKIIKNKSPESILNNPSNLSLIGKLDRWGKEAYIHLSKDYFSLDDLGFTNYDDDTTLTYEKELNLYAYIAKKINQKHTNKDNISNNNYPSVIILNPGKYRYAPSLRFRLSDEIGHIALGLKSDMHLKVDPYELADKMLSLDELSFYIIPDNEYDSSEKYKVSFELIDGKPHFKLKIGHNISNESFDDLRDNLRLGLIEFLSYRYYSKEELQELKDKGITRENGIYSIGTETEDGGLLCRGADIYKGEQKELNKNFRKSLNNCVKFKICGLSKNQSMRELPFAIFFFFAPSSPMYLYFTDPLTFNNLLIENLKNESVFIGFSVYTPLEALFNISEIPYAFNQGTRELLCEKVKDLNHVMDDYLNKEKNDEREEKE